MKTWYYVPVLHDGLMQTMRLSWRSMCAIRTTIEYGKRLSGAQTKRQRKQAQVWLGLSKRRARNRQPLEKLS